MLVIKVQFGAKTNFTDIVKTQSHTEQPWIQCSLLLVLEK